MTDWIKGRELLEPPYNLTKRDIFKDVQTGSLVPYMSPDSDWIKRHEILEPVERVWRVFPTPELQKKWLIELCLKQGRLEEAQKWSSKSDEEHIEAHKHDLNLDWGGAPPKYLVDLETFIDRNLPLMRQKYLQIMKDFPSQIKNLEEEFAPNRVWRDLDLGPAQKEVLMEKLLDASYPLDQVEPILRAESQKQSIPKAKSQKLTVRPGTHWEDIKITLISDEMARVKTPDWEKLLTYHELGLSDKRKGDAPKLLWGLLKVFAQNQGFISRDNPDYSSNLPDTAKALNRHLKELFGINDSIYQGHYKKEGGYRTKIFFSSKEDLSKHFGQTDKKVTVPDVKGLTKGKATGTPANSGKVIECKDEIKVEIADMFAQFQPED